MIDPIVASGVLDPFSTPGGPPPDPSVPQVGPAGPGDDEGLSWADVDLSRYLDGSYTPPVPTMLPRSDGLMLFYPGLTHSIHGESESGKSWIVQCEAARLVKIGQHVQMIDFESDAGPITGRMLELGCTPEQLRQYFHYKAPTVKPGASVEEYAEWLGMYDRRCALVIIDGVTDALGLWGLKTTDNDDWTSFNANFPKRLAKETGAAVVMVDHVTKSADGRGRFAIGGQAKMNTVTGAAYVVDVVEPMGRGVRGVLALGLAKDKGGYLRGRLGRMDRHRIQSVGDFILDASAPALGLLWALTPPPAVEEESDDLRLNIKRWLNDYPGSSLRQIVDGIGGRNTDVIAMVRALVDAGEVIIDRIGQKHAHSLIAPLFQPPLEPFPSAGNGSDLQ